MKCLFVFVLSVASTFAADFNDGQAARLVIGQETFTSQLDAPSEAVLGGAGGVAFANDTLFIADGSRAGASPTNNRVLIYPNLSGLLPAPTSELLYERKCPVCLGSASVVLGQPDFSSNGY